MYILTGTTQAGLPLALGPHANIRHLEAMATMANLAYWSVYRYGAAFHAAQTRTERRRLLVRHRADPEWLTEEPTHDHPDPDPERTDP